MNRETLSANLRMLGWTCNELLPSVHGTALSKYTYKDADIYIYIIPRTDEDYVQTMIKGYLESISCEEALQICIKRMEPE